MEKFFEDVLTLYWWIAVFGTGITLNILSAYAKPLLDKLLASWLGNRAHASSRRRRSLHKRVHTLLQDPDRQAFARYIVIVNILFTLVFWTLALQLIFFGTNIFPQFFQSGLFHSFHTGLLIGVAVALYIIGGWTFRRGVENGQALARAENIRRRLFSRGRRLRSIKQ